MIETLKRKRGRPRMRRPSHRYTKAQWAQHDAGVSDATKALAFMTKFCLTNLIEYPFEELLQTVHSNGGEIPECFALNWEEFEECKTCKSMDADGPVEGFYDPKTGEELGRDSYGVYVSCWIASWAKCLRELI